MANAMGVLVEPIWRDKDFRALSRTAQATYAQLLSQKELDRAGVVPYQPTKWVKGCDAFTLSDLQSDLDELVAARFIVIDDDTDEVLIRSYMRHNGVAKQPNVLKNASRCALAAASDAIRAVLATEFRRLQKPAATETARALDATLEEPFPEPIGNPSETLPEPFPNPSRGVEPFGNPSGTPGVGVGVGVVPTSVVKKVGGNADARLDAPAESLSGDRDATDHHHETLPDEEPPQRCKRHLGDAYVDEPCGPCANFRKAHERWTEREQVRTATARRTELEHAADTERAAINACDLCDDRGYRGARVCDHDPDADARNAAGMARVRAVLTGNPPPPTGFQRPRPKTKTNTQPTKGGPTTQAQAATAAP